MVGQAGEGNAPMTPQPRRLDLLQYQHEDNKHAGFLSLFKINSNMNSFKLSGFKAFREPSTRTSNQLPSAHHTLDKFVTIGYQTPRNVPTRCLP